MPRRPRSASSLVTDNTRIKNLINERLDAAITESISALDAYYAQEAHWPFELLKSFVDCREHLCKAQVIQHKELAQLSLPEDTNPDQPELTLNAPMRPGAEQARREREELDRHLAEVRRSD